MHCKELEVQEGMEEEQLDAELEQEVGPVEQGLEQDELLGLSESACLAFELY